MGRLRARRVLDMATTRAAGEATVAAAAPPPLLAGCSRKRLEAELVSPPVARKASRTLEAAALAVNMMSRMTLSDGALHSPVRGRT